MKKKLKKEWIKALRSGKYEQGQSFLCATNNDGKEEYCCLGVLIDIACDHEDWQPATGWSSRQVVYEFEQAACMPTAQLEDRLGLSRGQCRNLANKNDAGHSFARIADMIEADDTI